MIDITRDIHSLTAFKRDTTGLMKRMKRSRRPLVLTVKGKAEAVLMAPEVYQDLADRLDTIEGVRRGLAQAKRGLGRSVDAVFDEIQKDVANRRT